MISFFQSLSTAGMTFLLINMSGLMIYLAITLSIIVLDFYDKRHKRNVLDFIYLSFAVILCLHHYLSILAFYDHPIPLLERINHALLILPGIYFLLNKERLLSLRQEQQKLESAKFNQLKDEFLTVASHELRTPLSIISGFAEILLREKLGPLNDEQKRRVRKVLMQGQRLNRIVDELLDLSRIRSGRVMLKRDVFDFVPVLKACAEDHAVVCEQNNIRFEERIPDVLPDVVGDLDRITQVIVNLLHNAVKYTPAGGKIVLQAVHRPSEGAVQVSIRDTGIGIDPAEHGLIFNEFYRSANPISRKYSGSGLGLAIVKQLIDCHQGRVWVESEGLNKGSSFLFEIPVALANAVSFSENSLEVKPHPAL